MRAKNHLAGLLQDCVAGMGLKWPLKTVIDVPKEKSFGDLAANVALLLAKDAGSPPLEIAAALAASLRSASPHIRSVDTAGPGFINVTFTPEFWHTVVRETEDKGARYGSSTPETIRKIQVEFVSANPTGPLHIGHGRGAAVGDSLARVLRFAGFEVSTEYYINDAGRQMRLLGVSVWLRMQEQAGRFVIWPDDWYKGEYITDIAKELLAKSPELADMPEAEGIDRCFAYAVRTIMDGIRQDLADFRAHHDVWFSETDLVRSGAVEKAFARLAAAGHTYEKDGALWFRTTALGDDKDRVLRKSDGTLTYFASDIAYHAAKYDRGFDLAVDIWGADHHGYIPRMRAAVQAMGKPPENFTVILVQLVNLLKAGEQVAMSTRAGQFETLADVMREVGPDAARFMFLSRKSDSHLDFDLELVKERSMDNPVYYVQYAYARIRAVLRKAAERGLSLPDRSDSGMLALLSEPAELDMLRLLERFEDVVADAAAHLAPHHVSHFLMEVAGLLHSYYAAYQVLNAGSDSLARARLSLLRATGVVLSNGLALLGVTAPESM